MSNPSRNESALSPEKQALLKIRELKQQLTEARRGDTGDIAIVSMACRFPRQSSSPEAFWEDLLAGTDLVGEVPADRWDLDAFYDQDPDVPGKMYARHGVFLDNLDLMDPEFFGISPREATWVDPQQRLLLEVGWEALERAAWPADEVGAGTGIFVGWMHNDYQNEASDSFLNLNPYIATGAAGSFLCGRLAYYLGLQGPSVAVDTACSSSLVALHLACQSLHRHECDRALVGGVNAIVSPTTNILTCKLQALSPQGHSRAFDAAADGYLRGEGCGVVTIRRLADAQRDGDPVIGIIRGSSVGHNGFSSGLTAPNPRAQERVIREALHRAGVQPQDVAYLEAHGTGTELGDPIEMQAAAAALGPGRDPGHPLLVGSVKTNIGHLEAAAGMAGLIKVLLAFEHDQIPAQLNFQNPNPHIPWEQLPVQVVAQTTDWPDAGQSIAGPLIAGVSAFGMSGTNAHVVLQRPDSQVASDQSGNGQSANSVTDGQPQLLVLSGRSGQAVGQLAGRYRDWLRDHPHAELADVAYTAGAGRRHFEHRAALVANSVTQAGELLDGLERSGHSEKIVMRQARSAPRVAWQFTGQGSQYQAMTRGLYESQPVFRETLDQCDLLMSQWRNQSLLAVMFNDPNLLNHTSWTQPAIFAVQMGLVRLLNSWGVTPDVVLGHSVGQYAAACVAGILDWTDGLRLISHRGRLIGELPEGGAMVAIFAPVADIESALAGAADVSLAALNGTHTVISGPETAVADVARQFSDRGVRCKRLATSHAFHSVLMEPALEPFGQIASQLDYSPAQLPLICNRTGQPVAAGATLDGAYWQQHIREAVRYEESIQSLCQTGCDVLLEIGPQSVLTAMAAANWSGDRDALISCLKRDSDDVESVLTAAAQLYGHGVNLNFRAIDTRSRPRRIVLPTYPFQRRRFWGPDKPRAWHAAFHTAHPLLGGKCALAGLPREERFESRLEPDSPAWLPDHQVMDQTVFPGAGLVEIALAAADSGNLVNPVFEQPLQPDCRTVVQTIVREADDDRKTIEIYSAPENTAPESGSNWVRHFQAGIGPASPDNGQRLDLDELAKTCPETVTPDEFYAAMREFGLNYGPEFQTIQSIQFSPTEVLTQLKTNSDLRGFIMPPPLLDGAFHSLAVGLLRENDGSLFLPVGMEAVHCYQAIDSQVWCHARWTRPDGALREADLTLLDDEGHVVAQIKGLKVRQVSRTALRQMSGTGSQRLIYQLQWSNLRLPAPPAEKRNWLVIGSGEMADGSGEMADGSGGDRKSLASSIVQDLQEQGHQAACVSLNGATEPDSNVFTLPTPDAESWSQVFRKLASDNPDYAPNGIVWLLAGDQAADSPADLPADTQRNCSGLLGLVTALHAMGWRRLECGLQLVTCNAVSLPTDDASVADVRPAQTQYWGLGRVLGAEQPEFRCRLIDVQPAPHDSTTSIAAALRQVVLNDTPENQFAIRDQRILVPRLSQVAMPRTEPDAFQARSDASYLITGGLGMLGRQAAKWLADQGAGHVVLVSRRPASPPAQALIDEISQTGCSVIVHQADLGSRTDVAELFQRFGNDLPPLGGLIHAAGILDDGLLAGQTWERFENVLTPKAGGAALLHEFTADLSLDFFVLYSSAASVLGSPGQSNYATANAWLDGLAWHRRAAGLPATSINWGPWTEGMADDETIIRRLAMQGITPLAVDEAHDVLHKILSADLVQATVLDVDWSRMQMGMGGDTPSILEGLAPGQKRAQSGNSELVTQLKKLKPDQRQQLLLTTIQKELQDILSTPELPETDRPLIEMGLDSLMAVEFGMRLQKQLGDEFAIAPTMLFDHPTIDAISGHVVDLVSDLGTEESATPKSSDSESASRHIELDDVAIIGMGCRFPGAHDVGEFWQNLIHGVDSVREIPADRWDIDSFYSTNPEPGKMISREGGYLEDIGDFDAGFFNISDQEACWIDPQHRLLLEVSWKALEDAGIPTQPLEDPGVGVFMGIMSQDYAFLPRLTDVDVIEAFQGAGLAHSAGVGRISYVFGFEGPSLAIDTASSSSLVAVCQAVRSLQDGNCNMALAGGVNAILAPANSLLMSQAGLLSPDGRCKSFSAEADGFGRGEGCGVVVLKRLQDARRDGDRIMAVIRGSAIGHNGFSGGLTSPSGRSQARVISQALDNAGIAPSEVQYLEAHGTGTEYGDPMEIGAAASVYGKGRPEKDPLLVGSVKANISHLEAAGGVSGLIKTVLALHHGTIPQQLHFEHPSPHVPWDRLPLKMVSGTMPWPEVDERIAGVTALGLSGTNAHVVLSASPEKKPEREPGDQPDRDTHLLVLSARNESALHELAGSYQHYLHSVSDSQLADVCHTAGCGRRHFEHRAALVVRSSEQASRDLESLTSDASQSGIDAAHNGAPSNGSPARIARVHCGQSRPSFKLAWVIPGQTGVDVSAVQSLFRLEPVFRQLIHRFDRVLESTDGNTGGLLTDWLAGDSEGSETDFNGSDVGQFAIMAGLIRLWQNRGIEPDVVLGWGIGQYLAACLAGGMGLDDAFQLVVARRKVLATIADSSDAGQTQSGALAVEHALDEFERLADTFNYFPPDRPLVCSLDARIVPVHRLLGGSYWRRHCLESPAIDECFQALAEQECDGVLEPGSSGTGKAASQAASDDAPVWITGLAPDQTAVVSMLDGLGQLYVYGLNPDFRNLDEPWDRHRLSLPSYPFQRKRYWITELSQFAQS